ncbi:MAG: hypothetical protein M3P51_00415 [Chloroflexota bacterium]|nr:hypothetical protein [Chloroflexota bacterium]
MDNGRQAGLYEDFYSPEELGQLRRSAESGGVDAEIELARVALMRLLSSGQAEQNPELLLRAVDQVVRSIRVRHQVQGAAPRSLLQAADTILAELGLGGG